MENEKTFENKYGTAILLFCFPIPVPFIGLASGTQMLLTYILGFILKSAGAANRELVGIFTFFIIVNVVAITTLLVLHLRQPKEFRRGVRIFMYVVCIFIWVTFFVVSAIGLTRM